MSSMTVTSVVESAVIEVSTAAGISVIEVWLTTSTAVSAASVSAASVVVIP
jgi:hypothetical protein